MAAASRPGDPCANRVKRQSVRARRQMPGLCCLRSAPGATRVSDCAGHPLSSPAQNGQTRAESSKIAPAASALLSALEGLFERQGERLRRRLGGQEREDE